MSTLSKKKKKKTVHLFLTDRNVTSADKAVSENMKISNIKILIHKCEL
jgi:hypothetical protein